MKTVRVGLARFVMTMTRPAFSMTNKRLVSPGGLAMQTGLEKVKEPRALVQVKPKVGGAAGMDRVVFGTRWSGPLKLFSGTEKMSARARNRVRGRHRIPVIDPSRMNTTSSEPSDRKHSNYRISAIAPNHTTRSTRCHLPLKRTDTNPPSAAGGKSGTKPATMPSGSFRRLERDKLRIFPDKLHRLRSRERTG